MKAVIPTDTTDRTYRGRFETGTDVSILEVLAGTPRWRDLQAGGGTCEVLRELDVNSVRERIRDGDFEWGYYGSGSLGTGEAVLVDALGMRPSVDMVQAFCVEVVAQLGEHSDAPWLLSWRLVVRWAQAWQAAQM